MIWWAVVVVIILAFVYVLVREPEPLPPPEPEPPPPVNPYTAVVEKPDPERMILSPTVIGYCPCCKTLRVEPFVSVTEDVTEDV